MKIVHISLITLLMVPAPGVAQRSAVEAAELPRDTESRLLALLDDPRTEVRRGPGRLEAGERVQGALFVEGGPFTVAGVVEGELVVLNGDLTLESGAEVSGDVTVVGGSVTEGTDATIRGSISIYRTSEGRYVDSRRSRDRDRGDCRRPGCRRDGEGRDWDEVDDWEEHLWGDASATIRVDESYNRVEGLPVLFGPVLQTGGSAPLRIEALGIWRSVSGDFDTEDMGWLVRAEQGLFDRRLRLGGSWRSVMEPIEAWHMSDLESSLSTVLFHEDPRDWYEREGWSAHLALRPRSVPVSATLEYRDDEHRSAPVRDPWALGGGGWRAQPLAAEGSLRSVVLSAELDTRDSRGDPFAGWLLRGSVRHAPDPDLVLETSPGLPRAPIAFDDALTTAFVDVRRYLPVGRRATLALRGVAGGALSENALPPQLHHAAGGVGTLPGHADFALDCGARAAGATAREGSYPLYGCDRLALFQAEYRSGVHIGVGSGDWDDDWRGVDIDLDFDWVFFFDAARGWALEGPSPVVREDAGPLYDAGVGLLFGDLGVYFAAPLGDGGGDSRFFLRLRRRF